MEITSLEIVAPIICPDEKKGNKKFERTSYGGKSG